MLSYARVAIADIAASLASWRIWFTLAINDVRRRYRRSIVGQFWLTLGLGATVGGLGLVYSTIFRIEIAEYLPYISVTLVAWTLISTTLSESCLAFIDSEGIMRHAAFGRSVFVFRVQLRNLIVGSHNVIIPAIVFVVLHYEVNSNVWWLIPGLLLVLANLLWMGYALAVISTRFRDIPQIVQSILQVLFFITPVMFKPAQLGSRAELLLVINPFAHLLALLRDPLLGVAPSGLSLAVASTMALGFWVLFLPFFGRYAPRVVLWL